jgi:enamine deaminase RidA (YjgF/YER057c/UK114 family)
MTGRVSSRLAELGIVLPSPAAPAANYVPFVQSGSLLFVSGQLPMENGKLAVTGTIGDGLTIEDGQRAARLCAINLLAQARAALGGDLDRVVRCIKLGGFVACTTAFDQHPAVINGASNLMVDVLGDAGRHARFAVGANVLPFGAAVEVEAIFEVA